MYFIYTPWLVRKLLPDVTWHISGREKKLYLTFDDGPTPGVTEWVLSTLSEYKAKATFFLVGKQIQRYPDLYRQILLHQHSVGNHTYTHLNGWNSSFESYLTDVALCSHIMETYQVEKMSAQSSSAHRLFRPPYGRLTLSQYRHLKIHYHIVMWSILTADYNRQLSGKSCFDAYIKHVRPGSVIVFHDSMNALPRLSYCLPKTLEYFSRMGYAFEAINEHRAHGHPNPL